jgi:cobalamin synthase
MSVFSRLGLIMGALFVVDSFVYWALQSDKQGFALILFAGLGLIYLGVYALLAVRKAGRPAAGEEGPGEPHIGPTIWPLVFAVSAVVMVIGILVTPAILVVGAILFVAAAIGWILAARRQWHAGGHGEEEHASSTTGH